MSSPKTWLLFGVFLFSMGCSPRKGPTKFDDGVYTGGFDRDGLRHGKGSYKWNNGDHYEGQFKNGKRHGKGVFVWAAGSRFEGEYLYGKRHGEGTYTWDNGSHYIGGYKFGYRQGPGTFVDRNGSRYSGGWHSDKKEGYGKLTQSGGRLIEGKWKNNERIEILKDSGKGDDSTRKPPIHEKTSSVSSTTALSPTPETSVEVQPPPVETIAPPIKEEPPPLPGEPVEIAPPPPPGVELPPLPGEPVEIAPPPPPGEELPPLPGEPVEIAPPPTEIKENVTAWKGTQEEAENYLESRERGEVSALHVKETGKPFEGTIIIVLEDGSKQGQVTVVGGLLHGEEILWGKDGEILERNRYENGKLVAEEIIPKKE